MIPLRLRRLRIARTWGLGALVAVRLGLPFSARASAQVAARWALRALEGKY